MTNAGGRSYAELRLVAPRPSVDVGLGAHRQALLGEDAGDDPVALPAHPPWNGQARLDSLRESLQKLDVGLSDYLGTILDLVEDGNTVAVRRRISGRHTGEVMGVAPTGMVVEAEEIMIMEFRGDRIARISSIPDRMGIAQQLGAVPSLV